MRCLGGWMSAATIVAMLVLPASVHAAVPDIKIEPGVDSTRVTWSLPPGMNSYLIEAASTPDTYTDGLKGWFLVEHRVSFQLLPAGATSAWLYIPAGTYYVHVGFYGTCEAPHSLTCQKEFTTPRAVSIPGQPPVLTAAAGGGGGLGRHPYAAWSISQRMKPHWFEVATSPETYTDGPFAGAYLDENTVVFDTVPEIDPGRSRTSYFSPSRLAGGTYYVHVSGVDRISCPTPQSENCTEFWSNSLPLVVPYFPPELASVARVGRKVRAAWQVPDWTVNDVIEIATSPDVYLAGPYRHGFKNANLVWLDYGLDVDQQEYVTPMDLLPGTYYVHVGAIAPDACPAFDAPTCLDEYSRTLAVTIPEDARPVPKAATADDKTAFASLVVRARQDVDKLSVRAGMAEQGIISASGVVRAGKLPKARKLIPASASANPGKAVTLRLKLPKKARRWARRALARHKRVKAIVTITATDAAGNTAVQRQDIVLKR
jgi:hypothetical protein